MRSVCETLNLLECVWGWRHVSNRDTILIKLKVYNCSWTCKRSELTISRRSALGLIAPLSNMFMQPVSDSCLFCHWTSM